MMANYSSNPSAAPQLKPQTPVNGMHAAQSPAVHNVRTSASVSERPGSPVKHSAPPAPVLAPSSISTNGASQERASGVRMHSSGLPPSSPSWMMQREARGSQSEPYRAGTGTPGDTTPDLGQGVYASFSSHYSSRGKGAGGGVDERESGHGSQARTTTRRTTDSLDPDPDGLQAGLRASGERFALIFSQLDELSLNSGLSKRDAAKSSASGEPITPSSGSVSARAGAGASESMSSSASTDREAPKSSPAAAALESAASGQSQSDRTSTSIKAFPTAVAPAGEAATESDASTVEQLHRQLLVTQRSQQEAVSRATVLASHTASLQEQLLRAEERERELQERIRDRDAKLAASAEKLQAMDELKSSSDSKERQLEIVSGRLRDAEA
jgi:hypothetical protein